MEVMEDGNLIDKVNILIQRDLDYYKDKQTILQEPICSGIVGGRLDFPRSVSFASMKLVLWWEDEHVAAYRKQSGFLQKKIEQFGDDARSGGCGGVVKSSDPKKFITSVCNSAKDLLAHLHVLTQEALDHADLTVLTGTIGATSLLKNCLWYYQQSVEDSEGLLLETQKKYQEMEEALAERLLDLHIRLLSLYILQDDDCLDWENCKPFFEMERGSYVIQMWWLYMKGTQDSLWETVPPKMAQRVFAGMLNESLTILAVRYNQALPSEARTKLLTVDLSNLLLCLAQLLPSVCENSDQLMDTSMTKSKILRDIHSKCQELLHCLIFRSASLDLLDKVLRKNSEEIELTKCRKPKDPCSWISFAFSHIFDDTNFSLNTETEIILELVVLLRQPQPCWSLLVKLLGIHDFKVLKLIMKLSIQKSSEQLISSPKKIGSCELFLCGNQCNSGMTEASLVYTKSHFFHLFKAVSAILITIGTSEDILSQLIHPISRKKDWSKCLDRKNVWNQIKPAWFVAITDLVKPLIPTTIKTTIDAIKTGASTYQATSIILVCLSYYWDILDTENLTRVTDMLQDIIPSEITPLAHSVLLQTLISALYTELANISSDESSGDKEIASTLAEALCSIDEDNKHTDQIAEFLQEIEDCSKSEGSSNKFEEIYESLTSDLLLTDHGKQSLKMLFSFLNNNEDWLFSKLLRPDSGTSESFIIRAQRPRGNLLYTMFHIGNKPFDQALSGEWKPDYLSLLQTPMEISLERISNHINKRWEFRDINSTSLSTKDVQAINNISSNLSSLLA